MPRKPLLFALAVCTGVVGCVPLLATVREPQSGRVLDGSAGLPIEGATVVVESWRVPTPPGFSYPTLRHVVQVQTDSSGGWAVGRERDWTIGILAADGFPLYVDTYCVFAPGYQPFKLNPHPDWFLDRSLRPEEDPDLWRLPQAVILEPSQHAEASGPTVVEGLSPCGQPLSPADGAG